MKDETTDKLVELVDKAVSVAEKELKRLSNLDSSLVPTESAALTVKNLKMLRENLIKGAISKSHGGNLGLSRNIGEWCHDGELPKLASEIDNYFREKMI